MNEQHDPTEVYEDGVRLFTIPSGAKVEIDDDNCIETEIVLDPSALINHDLEGFLDLVSMEATDTELLMDVNYTAKSITPQGNIIFVVTGDISMILEMEADNG